jgi:hypothetical protein
LRFELYPYRDVFPFIASGTPRDPARTRTNQWLKLKDERCMISGGGARWCTVVHGTITADEHSE